MENGPETAAPRDRHGRFQRGAPAGPGRPKSCRELIGAKTRNGELLIEILVDIATDSRARSEYGNQLTN